MKMIKFSKVSQELKKISNLIHQKGWVCAGEGNLSARVHGSWRIVNSGEIKIDFDVSKLNGEFILMSSKGAKIRDLRENPEKNLNLLKIQRNKIYLIRGKEPSTELKVHLLCHCEILKNELKENFLLHVHPENIIALSHPVKSEKELNKILKNIHFEFKYTFPEGVGFIKEKEPGSLELAKETAKKIKRYKCVIWKKHGIIARGKSFEECFDRIEIVEKLAGIYLKLI